MKQAVLIFSFFVVSINSFVKAQTLMQDGVTVTSCSGTFSDPQGNNDYIDFNGSMEMTFCSGSTDPIEFTFTAFETRENNDNLKIYDGPTSASTLIGTYSNTTGPGVVASTGTCLTFVWSTDGNQAARLGWLASFKCLVPQPNDCSNAYDLSTLTAPYSNTTATASNNFTECSMGSAPDHIFYYDLPAGSTITMNQTTNNYDSRHTLRYGGACPGANLIVCTDDSDTQVETWQNCTGTTQRVYWIQSGYSTNSGDYTLDWTITAGSCPTPPVNDDCSGATSLAVSPDQNCVTAVSGTITAATPSADANSCFGTDDDDVWYSFVATHTTHYVTISNVSGTVTDMYNAIFEGSCGSLGASIDCSDANANTVTGLTIGNTYFVRVYTYTGSTGQSVDFDICVTSPNPPPTNDECNNAIGLTVNGDEFCSSVTAGYTESATSSMTGCTGTANDDVWFSFVATSTVHDVELSNINNSNDMVFEVFSGSCGSLTSILCSDPNTNSLTGLTVNDTYYIRVYTYSSTGSNTGFDLCVNTPCGTGTPPSCNLDYTMTTITHSPYNYNSGSVISFADDRFANTFTNIGFPFCFDGVQYNDILVSSNAYISFPSCFTEIPTGSFAPGGTSPWSIDAAIPNNTDAPTNSIMLWHDIDPGVNGDVRTELYGTAPNRVFVIKYDDIAMFSCTNDRFNAQIMLYETTNNIEIHVTEKVVCSSWNSGAAILGLNNYNGTIAVTDAAHNYSNQWTENNTAYRFTYNCTDCITSLSDQKIDFKAENANKTTNKLNWVVNSDVSSVFSVEKSEDGSSFVSISSIESVENNDNYSFIDENVNSNFYYRIKQVLNNNDVLYSEVIFVKINEGISIGNPYPNPSDSKFTFEINSNSNTSMTFEIYDVSGRKINNELHQIKTGNNIVNIDCSLFEKGMYIVKIEFEDGSNEMHHIMKR